MTRQTTRLLTGARVSELTGIHPVTLPKLVQEGFLLRHPRLLRYTGHELVIARLLYELGTRASKPHAERDRKAVQKLRHALDEGQVRARTDLVLSSASSQLVNTAGELIDATSDLRTYRVIGVGAWLADYQEQEPEAFDEPVLITAEVQAA
ncbi:hypothetical protein OG800_50330 (plasmid) [Streptomyces sp. NBC_00445]|uniref:hypothetical protein n=1 Tax=Streptomyces sp. NBC_00445 TaxID=2975745 RepID=UPI002E1F0FF5